MQEGHACRFPRADGRKNRRSEGNMPLRGLMMRTRAAWSTPACFALPEPVARGPCLGWARALPGQRHAGDDLPALAQVVGPIDVSGNIGCQGVHLGRVTLPGTHDVGAAHLAVVERQSRTVRGHGGLRHRRPSA